LKLQAISHYHHIQPMHKMFTNLFPEAIKKGMIEIFGEQPMQPFLIDLLPAPMIPAESVLALLHQNEAAALSGYRLPKRRSEYLTGRICAKLATQELLNLTTRPSTPQTLSAIEITKTENGRPKVCVHAPENYTLKMDISISHSGDYGAALAAAASYCGIDLQLRQDSLLKVKEKYCIEAEFKLLEAFSTDIDTLTRLALLWAAKEAAKKALSHWQMPGFLDLEVEELQNFTNYTAFTLRITNIKNQTMPKQVTVIADTFNEYALAVCIMNKDHSNAGITRS
jgi:phosphopantetheinyl transferase (holo-ACP synthase)